MKLCAVITLGLFGTVLIVVGVVFPIVFPGIMAKQLDRKLSLSEDSPTIGNFISPPVPIFMQYYFFNVTNSQEILEGEKAKLDEIGPFTYEEKRLKHDLLWEEENFVTYKQRKTFIFRPDMSNGFTEDTMITVINPVLIGLAARLSDTSKVPDFVNGILAMLRLRLKQEPFITQKAGDLLFHGYQEDLFLILGQVTNDPIHKSGKFGFFYPKNNSHDGSYKVSTGIDGLEKLQLIDEWNGKPQLEFWKSDVCNMINGTEGSQFPRPISEDRKMNMYSSDLCRSLYLTFEKKVMHGNLELYRYILPYEVLAQSPENDCFCSDNFTCKDSMVNLSPCKKGTPIVASTPHFYMGTEDVVSAVEGLNPSKEEHQTFLDIEPNTGVTFQAHKRLQVSIPLKRYPSMPDLSRVQEVVFPIVWLNESAFVPIERANALYAKLTVPVLVVRYICWGLLALGVVMIIVAVTFGIKNCRTPAPLTEKSNGKISSKDKKDAVNEYDRTEAYKHLFT